jgi:glycosyltransferase involved in cell wall biosynthesis
MDFSLSKASRKHVLFITPVMPSLNGRGPGFRAYQWVCFLIRKYENVTVLCTSVYGVTQSMPDEFIRHRQIQIFAATREIGSFQRFLNVLTVKPSTYNTVNSKLENWLNELEISSPDLILGFKITSYPIVSWLKRRFRNAKTALDIDEVNSRRVFDIANLMWNNGLYWSSGKLIPEIIGYRVLESSVLHEIDSIYVSTKEEKVLFEEISAYRPCVIFENRFPKINPKGKRGSLFKFLFVGNSVHYPNRDAIERIVDDILPVVKSLTSKKFKILIIGGEPDRTTSKRAAQCEEIEYLFDANDLDAIYEQTDAALIPLRSGSGSSLKVLEALANKKAVISTPTGVRGFQLKHGIHCLISDEMGTLASYCAKLINNEELTTELAMKGHRWFLENHSYNAVPSQNHDNRSEFT